MTQSTALGEDTLEELIEIERALWTNEPNVYYDTYSPDAVLIFPGVGRIDRDTAVAAIRKENAEGRAWAEVSFIRAKGHWIIPDGVALITYTATARWNYEQTATKVLCATVYFRSDRDWRIALHQQTPTDAAGYDSDS